MAITLTDTCIYTIKHTDDLETAAKTPGLVTFTEDKRWVTAQKMLIKALRLGERVPIIFAPAEFTRFLFGWGLLDKVVLTAFPNFRDSRKRHIARRCCARRVTQSLYTRISSALTQFV